MNKAVTIRLGEHHLIKPIAKIGDKIKFGRNSWFISARRIKTKQMIHRMLRKEYYPYLIVTNTDDKTIGQFTMTVKPYNF